MTTHRLKMWQELSEYRREQEKRAAALTKIIRTVKSQQSAGFVPHRLDTYILFSRFLGLAHGNIRLSSKIADTLCGGLVDILGHPIEKSGYEDDGELWKEIYIDPIKRSSSPLVDKIPYAIEGWSIPVRSGLSGFGNLNPIMSRLGAQTNNLSKYTNFDWRLIVGHCTQRSSSFGLNNSTIKALSLMLYNYTVASTEWTMLLAKAVQPALPTPAYAPWFLHQGPEA